jgi:hypothetical protein
MPTPIARNFLLIRNAVTHPWVRREHGVGPSLLTEYISASA